ncbi:hypothetical protein B0O99DRAFT_690753 [Bisporella sp. PMI_857]|nr:hypothetical protein B0O99DRAFT_690753 [Bisporella sp. PMI_857]
MSSGFHLFNRRTDRWGMSQNNLVSARPLTFDRVMENRASASASPLFSLPVEILSKITEAISSSSLSNLALVNSDCRQIARSRQFSTVHLDYSHASVALVELLARETTERISKNGSTSFPSLGACIRQMTVSTSQAILRQRFAILDIDYTLDQETYSAISKAQMPKWQLANIAVDEVYLPQVASILCYRQSLPYLEYLDWEDVWNIPPSLYSAIAASSIQHLKYRSQVDLDFQLHLLDNARGWPLRTLHMEWGLVFHENAGNSLLTASILRLCAPTLETLTWCSHNLDDKYTFAPGSVPTFPNLRYLRLQRIITLVDSTILDAFLNAKLVSLSISYLGKEDSIMKQTLESRGCIPSLRTLVMHDPPLSFLLANPQLTKIDFGYNFCGFSAATLEIEILPRLAGFSNLTSLRIAWPVECSSMPTESLRLIGKLQNLSQLCIMCGRVGGWRRSWEVNHQEIREALSVLPRLKRLALQGDTYEALGNFSTPERYYVDTFATQGDLGYQGVDFLEIPDEDMGPLFNADQGKPFWEMRHAANMRAEAETYLNIFPNLEWIFLGERAMCIELDSSLGIRRIASTTKVENEYSFFIEIFGDGPNSD